MLRRVAVASASSLAAVQVYRFASLDRSDTHTTSSSVIQFLAFDALRLISTRARQKHDVDCQDFKLVQAEVLSTRLQANASTAYGRDHDFNHLLAANDVVDAFRASHPITFMSHYESYVTRIADGEPAVMNAEPETMLAATSGTSGKRNILPNTQTMSSTFFANGILVIFDTLRQACPECFTLQKTCKLAFAPNWTTSAGGLRIGPNSSGPKDKSFRRLLPLYSTPAEGYEISDDEYAALYVHALFAARDAHLGIIEANFISLPARMLSLLHRDGAAIADDLERGRVGDDVAARLPAHTVEALNSHLGGPNPVRAMEVRNALAGPATSSVDGAHAAEAPAEGDGRRHGLARRLWPQLKLFLANGTGAFASYASRLQDAEGAGVPILSTVLAASEGLMGVSLDPSLDGSASYCLVPRAMFFEFLPVAPPVDASSISSGAPAGAMAATASTAAMVPTVAAATMGDGRYGGTVLAHETIVGEDYELVITNLGGLCRYRVGDVVRVVGHHHGAPLVDFRYRIGQILNLRASPARPRTVS